MDPSSDTILQLKADGAHSRLGWLVAIIAQLSKMKNCAN